MSANTLTASVANTYADISPVGMSFSACDGDGWITDPRWVVSECRRGSGSRPGRMVVQVAMPFGEDEVTGGGVACNPGALIDRFKIGSFGMAENYEADSVAPRPVFIGTLAHVNHDLDTGYLLLTYLDMRHILRNVRVVGRWVCVWNATAQTRTLVYQQGWPAHFNPGGRPNCVFTDEGYPVFAPYPDYGLNDAEDVPASNPDAAKAADGSPKACYWKLYDILRYLKLACGGQAGDFGDNATYNALFPWTDNKWMREDIEWEDSYADLIDVEANANFDGGHGQTTQGTGTGRKGREIVLEGMAVLDAISELLSTAGGYEVAILPPKKSSLDGALCSIKIVRTLYHDDNGAVRLPMAAGGTPAAAMKTAAITGGNYEENGTNYTGAVIAAGQPIYVEKLMATALSAATGDIEPAWSAARYAQFKKLAGGSSVSVTMPDGSVEEVTGVGSCSQFSWQQAQRAFPEVLTTWRMRPGAAHQAGTSESAYPMAEIPRPPLPTGLSMWSEAGRYDYASFRAPMYAEISGEQLSGWQHGADFPGIEVWENGVIYLPMLRDMSVPSGQRCWSWIAGAEYATTTIDGDTAADIARRDVRINLAFPLDHRMIVAATDSGMSNSFAMPNANQLVNYQSNPDSSRISNGRSPREYLDLRQLYAAWLRKSSSPRPQSAGYSAAADKADWGLTAQNAIRTDMDLIKAHVSFAMLTRCRLYKGGRLKIPGYHTTEFEVGQQVKSFVLKGGSADGKEYPVRGVITDLAFKEDDHSIWTEITLS